MTLEQEIQEVTYTEGLEADEQSVFSKQERELTLEQEIKEFMKSIGVDVVGVAGPGRFDGPPSLDIKYIDKNVNSIITFALPFDVQAIYQYLEKKTALPHNLNQIRVHQRAMHAGLKLIDFLESKGYRSVTDSPNVLWRKTTDPLGMVPRFSHRYGAYVTGIAAPGLSGNAVTKEYGAAIVLQTIFTEAVLESDPIMDPREIFDNVCQHCMACSASCPSKMFENDKEDYALINGELYPRGKVRDLTLCTVSCAGYHSVSPNLKHSNWGKNIINDWVGVIPDPEKTNVMMELTKGLVNAIDLASTTKFMEVLSKPFEEGIFEAPNFPDYEDLPGETEGQKIRSFADKCEEIVGIPIDLPFLFTCASCLVVCGPTAEESQKRWKKYVKSGILTYKENYEPVVTHNIEEALAIREANPWKYPAAIKRRYLLAWWYILKAKVGIDFHGNREGKKYFRRLEEAISVKGKQDGHLDPSIRENVMEEIEANDGIAELAAGD